MLNESLLKTQAFKLKGRLFTFPVIQCILNDISAFQEQLALDIARAPKLLHEAAVVIDCSQLDDLLDIHSVVDAIRAVGLYPVGLQGDAVWIKQAAQALKLPLMHASSAQDKPWVEEMVKPRYVETPVRSGQQVVGRHADLVITHSVSHGAEVLSDRNIHIYGALRGKALAGLNGDREARIFCLSLDAELISIAGFYLVKEDMTPVHQPCQIRLINDILSIDLLS